MQFLGQVFVNLLLKNKIKLAIYRDKVTKLAVAPPKRSQGILVNRYVFQSLNISPTMTRLIGR